MGNFFNFLTIICLVIIIVVILKWKVVKKMFKDTFGKHLK